jgi:hypothetical protein
MSEQVGEREFTPRELEQQEIDRVFADQAKAQLEYRAAAEEARLNKLPFSSEATRQAEPRIRTARSRRLSQAREALDSADDNLRARSEEGYRTEED